MNAKTEEKLKLLPDKPGVYKMYNARGELIYVGKAVNLKNRVRQYFHSSKSQLPKVRAMVEHIDDFDFIIVGNETEALNLESNLIKQNKPYYNIMLKDDKHFPYIRIDFRQDFPAVQIVRRYKKDGAKYFGPFLSTLALREAITAVRENFPIRHCKYDINKMIARGERPCLMFHIGRCCAPCAGNISRETYHSYLNEVAALLQGNSRPYEEKLKRQMLEESEKLNFEKAALLRDRIRAMQSIGEKQAASSASSKSYDVFAFARNCGETLAYGLFIRNGNVVAADSFNISAGDEPFSEISAQFLMQFYIDSAYAPKQIIVSDEPEAAAQIESCLSESFGHKVRIYVPLRGEKRRQRELAKLNAEQTLARRNEEKRRESERGESALAALAEAVGLDSIPYRIECFDNSHLRGADTVGSMVVFINGKPEKSLYRRFKTKQDAKGDDYLAMKEHLTRRFERTLSGDEKFAELPDLLVVDGGRGQLNAALEVLGRYGISDIPALGIAEKNEEVILPDRKNALILKKSDPALLLLQRIRDEAHRFAISYHRNLHAKNSLYSALDGIRGIGSRRKRALYEKFLTVGEIAAAGVEEIKNTESMDTPSAKAVYEYFHKAEKNGEDTKIPKPKYKLLAIDIDDTLLPRDCPLSERNIKAIKRAQEAGIYVALATGRGYYGSSHVFKPLGLSNYIINYGGAVITDPKTGESVFETELDDKYIHDILDLAEKFGVHAHIYQGDCVIYEKTDEYIERYVGKLNLPHRLDPSIRGKHWTNVPKALIITAPERVDGLIEAFQARFNGEICISASSSGFIEFNRAGANKGTALKWLAEHLGIKQAETAAVGDNTLDYEMILWAGLGAAVENGSEKVKAAADVRIPSCKDDGVAFFIENYLLDE